MKGLPLVALALFAVGCGEKSDGTENAAPPPKAGAVAPPVVPNGITSGPGDMKPGSGQPGSASPGAGGTPGR